MGVQLSPRQQQVYDVLWPDNRSYDQASMRLGIEIETVKTHARRIQAKYAAAGQPLPDKRRHFVTH